MKKGRTWTKKHTRQKSDKPPQLPVQIIKITDLSRNGAGVGRDEKGRVVFVPFTAPDDRVKVRYVKVKPNYAQAELLEVIEPSPLRVTPRCPVFGRCGGCQWQHVPYEHQWRVKSAGVREALRLANVETPTQWQEFPAQHIWNYRNRVQLRGRGADLGFYEQGSHRLVPIQECAIVREEINRLLPDIRQRDLQQPTTYKVELSLSADGAVQNHWNQAHGAAGFRQVNDEQNVKLQHWIKSSLKPGAGVLDLFGGSGNLSLELMGLASEIHCVDLNAQRHGNNADDGTQTQCAQTQRHFHASAVLPWLKRRVRDTLRGIVSPRDKNWVAIIDPPRGALGEELDDIAQCLGQLAVNSLIFVGCKTDPWARDIARLLQMGWSFDAAAVFDFFPQTHHVESVALLTRTNSEKPAHAL